MIEKTDYYVYVLLRETGVPFLVGKGRRNRWCAHENDVAKGYDGRNPHKANIIRNLLNTIGEVPKVKAAQGLTEDAAFRLERLLIAMIGREPFGPLVNMTDGGDGFSGGRHNAEARRRISEYNRGRSWTPEQREKANTPEGKEALRRGQRAAAISNKTRGHKRTAEARLKMSLAKKGKPSPRKGVALTEAHRAKLRGPRGPQGPDRRSGPKGKRLYTDHMTHVQYLDFAPRHELDVRGGRPNTWNKDKSMTEEQKQKLRKPKGPRRKKIPEDAR